MKELSIFVDESGDWGDYSSHTPYYILGFVFHDQSQDISQLHNSLHENLNNIGFSPEKPIHSAPLIRNDKEYRDLTWSERQQIFRAINTFARKVNIRNQCFCFERKIYRDRESLARVMRRDIKQFVEDNLSYFQQWDRIVIYYDNGQQEVKRIIFDVFEELFRPEFKLISPSEYVLFQVADLCCTICLLKEKALRSAISKGEERFFATASASGLRTLKKQYFPLLKKNINEDSGRY